MSFPITSVVATLLINSSRLERRLGEEEADIGLAVEFIPTGALVGAEGFVDWFFNNKNTLARQLEHTLYS